MSDVKQKEAQELVSGLIARARAAQKIADTFSQERVLELARAISWNVVKPGNIEEIAKLHLKNHSLATIRVNTENFRKKSEVL